VDLAVEQQTEVPQVLVRPRYATLAQLGMTPGELAEFVETAFLGHPVGQWWEGGRSYDLVVRYPHIWRGSPDSIAATPISADGRRFTRLDQVARVERTLGPNLIQRENVQRRIVVMANTAGRDIRSVIEDIRAAVDASVELPEGTTVEYGGQFESEAKASRTIGGLSVLAVGGMWVLLAMAFRSGRDALLVMVNLPLALIGGVVVVLLTGGVLTVASLVGFVTLFGIATRNGILLVTHYRHLVQHEGEDLHGAVVRGSEERLIPVVMTAAGTGLALLPIALAAGEPGNEIQAPMALVILGGLVTSTLLNMVVLPVLFRQYAGPSPAAQEAS
jgi:Cu/Ag efflux pump CusA